MNKLVKLTLLISLTFCLSACSTLSFTNAAQPFDGTVHAISSLICSGYWSNHGSDGEEKGRSIGGRIVPTFGLVFYGTVDLVSTLLFDSLIFFPQRLGIIESGRPYAADRKPHSLLPCGTIDHSINIVFYIT